LFRDERHWSWLMSEFLPDVVAKARAGERPKSLRVWSAACSTGDEAFTIATCIADVISDCNQWNIEIIGTDIGVGAVEQATNAVFSERSMQLVPEQLRRRLFDQLPGTTSWKAKPALTRWTNFRQHNLLEPLKERPFDLIFLKNVLIYFDTASKKRALANIIPLLAPGGALVTSAAEGVTGLISELIKEKPWLYRRPSAKAKS
jgi:chemotaxis protein methyltransferase CheR